MIAVMWDVTSCRLADKYWRFRGTLCPHFQIRKISWMGRKVSVTASLSSSPPYPVSTLRMEVAHSSESPVFIYQSVWHHIPDGSYNVVLCGKKIWYIEDDNCTLSWSANSVFNLLVPELNFRCNLQNPWFKLQDLFFLASHIKQSKRKKPPQHCTRMAIIGWHTPYVIQGLQHAPCDAVFILPKGWKHFNH